MWDGDSGKFAIQLAPDEPDLPAILLERAHAHAPQKTGEYALRAASSCGERPAGGSDFVVTWPVPHGKAVADEGRLLVTRIAADRISGTIEARGCAYVEGKTTRTTLTATFEAVRFK